MRLFRSVLALESRLYDSLTAGNAHLDVGSELCGETLQKLMGHERLIEALASWIELPDSSLYPALRELAQITNQLYQFRGVKTVYRGFDPQSPYQCTMGLSERGLLSNPEQPFAVGDKRSYALQNKPLSFSLELDIARAFGKVIVRSDLQLGSDSVLVITDELSHLVCQKRGISSRTQREALVLPPFELDYVIHEIKR